ncbi:predicted protein [Histoplasma mississippiense (nom. inval.)]|uniref:predicted protein n=1 Tax=Ajellomyces capsulatus (strain NAm1 / WU24) TaxID=2059318 RepID=UPI000157CD12|nr:predicted protein [Histoplasma mississippiense (nom. inval.)]EDN10126.1 predicted protein [Histoplasma mississippiense (nom. inval.)]
MKLSSGSMAGLAMSLLSGSKLVAAQTWTSCNPMEKTCPPDPALGGTADFEFHSVSERFDVLGGAPTYGSNGASLAVAKQGDAPTLVSKFYIMFGHVDFVIKAAPGRGIVSSAVLQSDDLDEIDWEWLGVDNAQVQTNYFGKNQQGTFDRGQFHANPGNQDGFHTYSIDWNSDRLIWQIDGQTVRTLTAASAGASYPQTPMQIKAGVWAGGDPFQSSWNYRGSWQSIEAIGGKVNGHGTPGSGPQVESSIPPAEATRPPTTKGIIHPSEYPWVPSSTLKPESTPSITSFAGLPSEWIVTDSGRATPPSTASSASQSASRSSPSSPVSVSSSAGGPESPSATGTSSPNATVAPGTGAANLNFPISYGVSAICGLIAAVAFFQ